MLISQVLSSFLFEKTLSFSFEYRGRRLGDDSDGSELEYRDSNSETSSIDGGDHLERASCSSSDVAMESECLLFEYFESAAPPLRAPLYDKVLICKSKLVLSQLRFVKCELSNRILNGVYSISRKEAIVGVFLS